MWVVLRLVPAALAVAVLAVLATPAHAASRLEAGAGRADVTPPTGKYTMGYVRSDAVARGQHTRLMARAIVLRGPKQKLALVAVDLGFVPGGLLQEVAARLAGRGFDERSVLVSASHTHGGPAGYSNFTSDNFVAPTLGTPTDFSVETDPQLYGFLVRRIALAVERADDDLGPAWAAWGSTTLTGVTQNRSLEAHLANHGFDLPWGTGRVGQDPEGYLGTIDPQVDVLRVDRRRRGRRVPLGAWLSFANHGTVDPYTFGVYTADHHGHAIRVFEAAVRRAGKVRAGDEVVGAYGGSDAGDMSAGLERRGPAWSDVVGRAEAGAMLRAWRSAGRRLRADAELDVRWTRACWCGQEAGGGRVASEPSMGLPFLTGSEENRGPLFDLDGRHHEGDRLPVPLGDQAEKIRALGPPVARFPTAVPLMVVRLGAGALASVPGEMTVEMGRRTRAAVATAAASLGVRQVALAGYANEYVHYFTTPEEYRQQHYEGGSTLFGPFTSNMLRDELAGLARSMARGEPAKAPHPFDPREGVVPDLRPYDPGAEAGRPLTRPGPAARLTRASFAWQGAPEGLDRPLDTAFVAVERQVGGAWRRVADDLGVELLWRVDDAGRHEAFWQVPLHAGAGAHRFVVTANRYRLVSEPFPVTPSTELTPRVAEVRDGRVEVELAYPPQDDARDLISTPALASGGRIVARLGRQRVEVRPRRGTRFALPLPRGRERTLRIAAGAARDRYGNRNRGALVQPVRGR